MFYFNFQLFKDQLKLTTQLLVSQLDINNTGRINENQFLNSIRRNYSINELNMFLKFDIIPNEVLDEANMQQSVNGSVMSVRSNRVRYFEKKSNYEHVKFCIFILRILI